MFRLFTLGLLVIIGISILVLSIWLVVSVIKWVRRIATAGNDYVDQQKQEWERRKAEKDLPDFLVQGIRRMENIEKISAGVTNKWQLLLNPVLHQAQTVVQFGMEKPHQAELARSFFTVTLNAMENFVRALANDHGVMRDEEEEKARQSLEVFADDIQKYRTRLESKRRFDLQVMMEVIKQRLSR